MLKNGIKKGFFSRKRFFLLVHIFEFSLLYPKCFPLCYEWSHRALTLPKIPPPPPPCHHNPTHNYPKDIRTLANLPINYYSSLLKCYFLQPLIPEPAAYLPYSPTRQSLLRTPTPWCSENASQPLSWLTAGQHTDALQIHLVRLLLNLLLKHNWLNNHEVKNLYKDKYWETSWTL